MRDVMDESRTTASELPDDPALPGLRKIMTRGLAQVMSEPELELATLYMHNYVPGSRATLEARVANRRFVIKIYADDPSAEAEVYRRLAVLGLAGDFGPRVPRLLSWDRDQKILVLSWLEGPSASQLVKDGKGRRAGELAVGWLRAASGGDVRFGPRHGCGHLLYQVGVSVGALTAANPVLGATAKRTAKVLERTQPEEGTPHLVHGTLYARHVLDMGDGPGVIDWQQFGQGPVEVDAGMFLATISRLALRHSDAAGAAARAEETFVSRTRGLVDPLALDWYRAAGLLHLAASGLKTGLKRFVPPEAHALVAEAARRAAPAGAAPAFVFPETPRPFARIRSAFTIRSRTPSLVHPVGPAATTQPDPDKARGIGGTKPR